MSKKTPAKSKPATIPTPTDRNVALTMKMRDGENPHEVIAKHLTAPAATNAGAIMAWSSSLTDINALNDVLKGNVEAMHAGDMRQVEATLLAQAQTLNMLFTSLVHRCGETQALQLFEARMRIALKAQAQCRSTLETLAEIKNPRPVAFVKQANISGGHQQVNNGVQPPGQFPETNTRERAPARENEGAQNRLLEASHGERLDTRAQGTAGRAHPHVAAVGALNGAEDERG
jgi:hypothetical protein